MKTLKTALILIIAFAMGTSCTKEQMQGSTQSAAPAYDTVAALMGVWDLDKCNYNSSSNKLFRLNKLTLNPDYTYSLNGLFYCNYYVGAFGSAYLGVKTESGHWSFKNQVLSLKAVTITENPGPNTFINDIKVNYNLNYGTKSPAVYDTSAFGNCLVGFISSGTLKLSTVQNQIYAYTDQDSADDYSWVHIDEVQYQFVLGNQ